MQILVYFPGLPAIAPGRDHRLGLAFANASEHRVRVIALVADHGLHPGGQGLGNAVKALAIGFLST